LWAAVYGALLGSRDALIMPMFADLYGTNNLGKITGINTSFNLITMGLGPLIFGMSRDFSGSYTIAVMAAAGLNLVFSLGLFCSSIPEDPEQEQVSIVEESFDYDGLELTE